jgi:PIN domain nuclease of toxin-antitoxin system
MKILIDTNILLFILFDDAKLSKKEIEIISDDNNEIIVSSISLFEISLKYSINKLELNNITPDKIPDLLIRNGYIIEDIDYITYSSYYKLPSEFHKDPFDRLLIWEAIRKNYCLLSKDSAFVNYQKYGLKLL